MFTELSNYLSYTFIQYAFIVGILTALSSSILGVVLVLKRYSMIGDGLSHVAFAAATVATVLGVFNNIVVVMPLTIICAIFILKNGERKKIMGDASIAMISVSALAIGYLIMNIFGTSSNLSQDVCTTLFGSTSILTLSKLDVYISILMTILVLSLFILCYNKIFSVTFDEDFTKTSGVNTDLYNLIIAIVTAIIVVLAMNFVGSLLTAALIIFPSLSAMRILNTFKSVVIASAIFSIICSILGMSLSIVYSTPVGPTIVLINIIIFFVCATIEKLKS